MLLQPEAAPVGTEIPVSVLTPGGIVLSMGGLWTMSVCMYVDGPTESQVESRSWGHGESRALKFLGIF